MKKLFFLSALFFQIYFAQIAYSQNTSSWPSRPVKIVVPYGPAGSSDTLARIVSEQLSQTFKQSFIIDNKAGAGGTIGSEFVAKSQPDGYTLVISGIGSHVIAPNLYPNKYDPVKDFTHIALLGGPPLGLVVNPNLPIQNLKGFINYVKNQPDGIVYGSPGIGTHGNIVGEYFAEIAGLKLTHVGYKGGSSVVNDIVGGQLPAGIITVTSAKSLIQANKLRLIAITSAKRLENFPNVPTFSELGYPKLTSTTWFSLSGPAGMPETITNKINAAVNEAMTTPLAKERLTFEDMEFQAMGAEAFNKFIQSEILTWGGISKKIQLQNK